MIVKLAEAANYTCPIMSAHRPIPCQGRACMAWREAGARWAPTIHCENPYAATEPPRPVGLPPEWVFKPYVLESVWAHWQGPTSLSEASAQGFCGMMPS